HKLMMPSVHSEIKPLFLQKFALETAPKALPRLVFLL
ncbi:MAG: hypothetical protein RLZZ126_992, partial [Pseudomonadota bacterium]